MPVTTGEIWNIWRDNPDLASTGRLHRRPRAALLGRLPLERRRSTRPSTATTCCATCSRQAHRDRRVRLAERGLQSAQRRSRAVRAGLRAAQLRRPRRSARHRLQHRRGDRSALEELRRRRRSLLGHPQRQPRAEIRLDRPGRRIPTIGSSPTIALLVGILLVAADPAAGAADRRSRRCCWRPPPMASAPGPRPCSPSGTDIISSSARPSR